MNYNLCISKLAILFCRGNINCQSFSPRESTSCGVAHRKQLVELFLMRYRQGYRIQLSVYCYQQSFACVSHYLNAKQILFFLQEPIAAWFPSNSRTDKNIVVACKSGQLHKISIGETSEPAKTPNEKASYRGVDGFICRAIYMHEDFMYIYPCS